MEVDEENDTDKSICDLPEEIVEIILMKLSPYNDLRSASLVCRSWWRLVQVVKRKLRQIYIQSVANSTLEWTSIRPDVGSQITERYSHCCCYYDKSLYVFGGCTASKTTLNDLWRFDLVSREWIRPLAMGTYPSPKACASMVVYQDNLVLYGGWSHPTPFPLHQAARFFSELHVYKPATNRWSHLTTLSQQSPVAGHSASVIGDKMVVFGGSQVPGVRTNDVIYFDFLEVTWKVPRIVGNIKPSPRYGHTQVTLDDTHILIMGGLGGGNLGPHTVLYDCWLLSINEDEWRWEQITIDNTEYTGRQLWCHSACKVSNMVVTLSKPVNQPEKTPKANNPDGAKSNTNSKTWVPPKENVNKSAVSANGGACNTVSSANGGACNTVSEKTDQSEQASNNSESFSATNGEPGVSNDNSQLEALKKSHDQLDNQSHLENPVAGTSNPRPGLPSVRPNAMNNRQKQLEALLKYEKKIRQSDTSGPPGQAGPPGHFAPPGPSGISQNRHNIRPHIQKSQKTNSVESRLIPHVLDISKVIEERTASWLKLNYDNTCGAPGETIFFSLVEGRGEILMFGGIDKDFHSLQISHDCSRSVNNTLHVLKPCYDVL
ncbi:F-box only protein 42 [Mactra antiquata]